MSPTIELFKAVRDARLTEQRALDIMQEAGAISDLCLRLADAAESDCAKGIAAIQEYQRFQKV